MIPRSSLHRRAALRRMAGWTLAVASSDGLAGRLRAAAADLTPGAAARAAELAELNEALARLHPQYDPEARMLRRPFSSPGYHTTLQGGMVHPTRDSLRYALACLDTGSAELAGRAAGILERVVRLQDRDPASKTYGIWSWFLEEPLERMAPPDWNWADFCGAILLQVARDHPDRLPAGLKPELDDAIRRAAHSIRRRNVGPDYTNIAMMGTYVTLVAAERLGDAELLGYARARLRRLHDHIRGRGAFTEYNSPAYTVVALKELARMRRDFTRAEDIALVQPLYRMAWLEIAQHFHPATRQWAGPHSRCYQTLLAAETLALVQRSTEGRVHFGARAPDLDATRLRTPCPPDLESRFLESRTEDHRQVFIPGEHPVVGTTWQTPGWVLGSVNRGDLWNQRRPLLAYWGSAERPSYLRLRFLRDGGDFAAVQFHSLQREGQVLAALNFATDGGQTHVSLDRMKDGVFEADDLRLAFEFGGAAGGQFPDVPTPASGDMPWQWAFDGIGIHACVPFARLGGDGPAPRWERTRQADTWRQELVLHHGARRRFNLRQASPAAIIVALALAPGTAPAPDARPTVEPLDGHTALKASWEGLAIEVPLQPLKAAEFPASVRFSGPPPPPKAP